MLEVLVANVSKCSYRPANRSPPLSPTVSEQRPGAAPSCVAAGWVQRSMATLTAAPQGHATDSVEVRLRT